MTTVQVFDPAMCCSTGICGPEVDPLLVRFAADMQWLASQGVVVERFNLGNQPDAFTGNPVVLRALNERGPEALPIVMVNGEIVSSGHYPLREELMSLAGRDATTAWKEALMPGTAGLVVLNPAGAHNDQSTDGTCCTTKAGCC
jgi:hypothetical protein